MYVHKVRPLEKIDDISDQTLSISPSICSLSINLPAPRYAFKYIKTPEKDFMLHEPLSWYLRVVMLSGFVVWRPWMLFHCIVFTFVLCVAISFYRGQIYHEP